MRHRTTYVPTRRTTGPLAALLLAAAALQACGPTCQTSCRKVYAPEECAMQTPGQSWEDMYADCVDECELALQTPGELGGYDPDQRYGGTDDPGASVVLENERQAAAWMDCVTETECGRMAEGYCAPI